MLGEFILTLACVLCAGFSMISPLIFTFILLTTVYLVFLHLVLLVTTVGKQCFEYFYICHVFSSSSLLLLI